MQFVVRESDAARRPGSGQTYQVLRPDVRGEQRCADDEPSQAMAGEKVVVGGIFPTHHDPRGQPRENREVYEYDEPIDPSHGC